MDKSVLILNKSYYAFQITTWQKAISLLYQDHADIVDLDYVRYTFSEWLKYSNTLSTNHKGFVHSSTMRLAIPEVIILKTYDKLPFSEVRFSRNNLHEHYSYKCCYCGKKYSKDKLTLDHVLARSHGGKTEWGNIVLACVECNRLKSDKSVEEVGYTMHYTPSKPEWKSPLFKYIRNNVHLNPSWINFLECIV